MLQQLERGQKGPKLPDTLSGNSEYAQTLAGRRAGEALRELKRGKTGPQLPDTLSGNSEYRQVLATEQIEERQADDENKLNRGGRPTKNPSQSATGLLPDTLSRSSFDRKGNRFTVEPDAMSGSKPEYRQVLDQEQIEPRQAMSLIVWSLLTGQQVCRGGNEGRSQMVVVRGIRNRRQITDVGHMFVIRWNL